MSFRVKLEYYGALLPRQNYYYKYWYKLFIEVNGKPINIRCESMNRIKNYMTTTPELDEEMRQLVVKYVTFLGWAADQLARGGTWRATYMPPTYKIDGAHYLFHNPKVINPVNLEVYGKEDEKYNDFRKYFNYEMLAPRESMDECEDQKAWLSSLTHEDADWMLSCSTSMIELEY